MTSSPPHSPLSERSLPRASGHGAPAPLYVFIRMAAAVLLVLFTGLAGGMVLERYVVQGSASREVSFPDLEAIADLIDENYYYRPTTENETEQLNRQMEQQAIAGALSSLDDDYTRYLGPDLSATAQEDLEGRHGGIGVDVVIDRGLLVVANVVAESPADDAGIRRGDAIQRIDNQPVTVDHYDRLVRQLRGDVGTTVDLSFSRRASGETFVVTLVREEIVVPPVTLRMIEGTSIGWLRITIFGDETVAEVEDAIRAIEQQGATGIVLDLRGNSGGWVTSAQGVLGRFLEPAVGPALYEDTSPGPGGEEPLPILRDEDSPTTDLPIVVLIDRGTASAAEIVAGALKDHERAVVVGEQTFGKGSVQRIFAFPDGATLRVTVAEWFTPDKRRIQQQGIHPDIEVTAGQDALRGSDPALQIAVEVLRVGTTRSGDLASGAASPVPSSVTVSAQ